MKTPEQKAKKAAYMREYYHANKAKAIALVTRYREANKEKIKAKKKCLKRTPAQRKAEYQKNAEKIKARSKAWCAANPDRKTAASRKYYSENKASYISNARKRRHSLIGTFNQKEIDAIYAAQHGNCAGCAKPFTASRKYEMDHVMPVSKGGLNTADSIQLLCKPCNRRKFTMLPDQWAASLGKLFV